MRAIPNLTKCVTISLTVTLAAACTEPSFSDAPTAPTLHDEGSPLTELKPSAADEAARERIADALRPLATTDDETLLARAPTFGTALGYDPKSAANLSLIQQSSLALNEAELEKLGQQGFVIAKRRQFPHVALGYKTIYALDLPVFISLDAILETVHLSYKSILKSVEGVFLTDDLSILLKAARSKLASGVITDPEIAADLDLYFAVATSLMEGRTVAPVNGARAETIETIVKAATAASGIVSTSLFGDVREIDYSQFSPRAHYVDTVELQRYFRASMWLGRTDFRLIETLSDGKQVFRRRQFQAMLALRTLLEGDARAAFSRIDTVISAFVGERDYMTLDEVDALVKDLGDQGSARSDAEIAGVIVSRGYGAQRVASQVMMKDPALADKTLPLDRSFALLGQRYTVDAHVFSNVTYDRLNRPGKPARYLPNPLDVAYAALQNPAALPILYPDIKRYGHMQALEASRVLVDMHDPGYWEKNLYNLWLSALRAASPGAEAQEPLKHGLPEVVGTDAWQRRILNTQLASWAELRHDATLYAKQAYTGGLSCYFPDGYVDPYSEVYERLRRYALKGQEVVAQLAPHAPNEQRVQGAIQSYFAELARVTSMLRDMAEHQRSGQPFDEAQMAFLNQAVTSSGCANTDRAYGGWYGRLLYERDETEMDPCIADVHTDPGGPDRSPRVLHVAVGLPRLMVVTANTCEGPRAYAGIASAYHELSQPGLTRFTDPMWEKRARLEPDVPWMRPILP